MAIIDFQVQLSPTAGAAGEETLSGSGLGFFGSTAGSSVQIGSYQDTTYVSNADGSTTTTNCNNIKYTTDTAHPSGWASVNAAGGGTYAIGLSGVKSAAATLGIRFGHSTPVKTQNVQLRIYDRTNINYPASGVNTKVAEIVNFNGSAFNTQGSTGSASDVVGSGDAFWWGEPWPSEIVGIYNKWENSLGTVFVNATENDAKVNGDARLKTAAVAGNDESVGGSGIVVPLLDSPGSGGKQLQNTEQAGATGMIWPKWTQYINSTAKQTLWHSADVGFGIGTDYKNLTHGGTGVDTHHTWAIALSASPLSIGSKEQYGLYVSLEYL